MLVALYKTKKALKEAKGQMFRHQETSMFGIEYTDNGTLTVVGPSAYERKWFARVTIVDGAISKVS